MCQQSAHSRLSGCKAKFHIRECSSCTEWFLVLGRHFLLTKKEPTTVTLLTCYRLCVFASGSWITNIFSCFTLIIVSCLHLGQNSGKFSSTVSSRILTLVLFLQNGHNIHSLLHTLPPLSLVFINICHLNI